MKFLPLCVLLLSMLSVGATAPIKALVLDGQNNHDWKASTPHLKKILEDTGLFIVDVATSPPKGGDMNSFRPTFSEYAVVVSNYNGESWTEETNTALINFVRAGGGFVVLHAADNAFPKWKEYNEMIGVGGWEGRDEKSGPWVYWDEKIMRDASPGRGGDHGSIHRFQIVTRNPDHPITRGLPVKWMHADDELYNRLRGPAENLTLLATAFDDPATRGSGRHEPVLFTIDYGEGRVFHSTLGHVRGDPIAQRCVGFIVTFQRGSEWAATGEVTQKVPPDFPTDDATSVRQPVVTDLGKAIR
jgi:type 1 glutamine amidotransferase